MSARAYKQVWRHPTHPEAERFLRSMDEDSAPDRESVVFAAMIVPRIGFGYIRPRREVGLTTLHSIRCRRGFGHQARLSSSQPVPEARCVIGRGTRGAPSLWLCQSAGGACQSVSEDYETVQAPTKPLPADCVGLIQYLTSVPTPYSPGECFRRRRTLHSPRPRW